MINSNVGVGKKQTLHRFVKRKIYIHFQLPALELQMTQSWLYFLIILSLKLLHKLLFNSYRKVNNIW